MAGADLRQKHQRRVLGFAGTAIADEAGFIDDKTVLALPDQRLVSLERHAATAFQFSYNIIKYAHESVKRRGAKSGSLLRRAVL